MSARQLRYLAVHQMTKTYSLCLSLAHLNPNPSQVTSLTYINVTSIDMSCYHTSQKSIKKKGAPQELKVTS